MPSSDPSSVSSTSPSFITSSTAGEIHDLIRAIGEIHYLIRTIRELHNLLRAIGEIYRTH